MPTPPPPPNPQRTSEARAAFTATLTTLGTSLDANLRLRASDIHANASAITRQEASLAQQTTCLKKESERYQKVADESRGKLKEIGDIQNWAEMLERELLVLEETVRLGEEGERGRRKDGEGEREEEEGERERGKGGWF